MGYEPAKVDSGGRVDNRSTKELVMSLKSEFQTSSFEFVASILASREEKLKREIATKAEENQGLWLENEQSRLFIMKLEEERERWRTEAEKTKREIHGLRLEKKQARLEKMRLEDELKSCRMEAEKAKDFEDRVNRLGEEMKKLQAVRLAGSEDVGRGGVQEPPENLGEGVRLTKEGNRISSASGLKKVDDNKQLNVEMNVKKEKEDLVSGGGIEVCKRVELGMELNVKENEGGGKIGLNRSVDLKSHQADSSSGNARPAPAGGIFVEISDSDDEPTPSKAPKETTSKQPPAGAGHSGKTAAEDGTGVLKRKCSSFGASDHSDQHPKKLTKHHDMIHISRTVAAPAKLGPKQALAAVPSPSSSSSSSASSDDDVLVELLQDQQSWDQN
ncbi:unnamed protein product [Linum trigynum]|uniref:Uncharacterized protein n=1 Tax=Linum trigynum TaxID=586398 RepID=A0AAV2EKH1_9ROSI